MAFGATSVATRVKEKVAMTAFSTAINMVTESPGTAIGNIINGASVARQELI